MRKKDKSVKTDIPSFTEAADAQTVQKICDLVTWDFGKQQKRTMILRLCGIDSEGEPLYLLEAE